MTAAPLTGGTDSREDDADSHRALVTDGFDLPPDLGGHSEAPPAYSEQYDQIQLEQSGFAAGAVVTGDGRVNININQTSRKFSDLLTPALQSQVYPPEKTAIQSLPPPYIPPSLGGRPGQTPPPKLNVVIQIVGSRGDVQPFVALGKVLQETYGHRVRLATHATFQKFVEENGLEFFSIGGDPAELMAFMVKNPGLMPGFDALKSGEVTKRRTGIEQIILGCWRSCFETGTGLGPPPKPHKRNEPLDERSFTLPTTIDDRPFVADVIIANPPSFAHIHIAEKLGIPLHMMFTMPWSPTRAFPHPLANIQSTNTDVVMTNFVSYAMVEMMTWQGLGDVINRFRTNVLDLEPMSLIWAPGILSRLHVPTTYCWSPALIPKPNDWSREISIAGFYFLNLASNYTPEPDLAAFLAAGPPPVYIGFGSIVVEDPNKLTRMIFDAIQATGVRALVSKGWGGIGADSVGIPDGVFMLGNCPHDWLFQHVSAVVHHGGAGTSAAGIKLGKPTVVVPFFGDQPFWGAMIARAGAGPNPIPYAELTAEKLAGAIQECLKPEIQAKAQELGEKIREEKGTDVGGKSFHEFLDLEAMRCSIAPSRVAVWRVRRTQIRLSALAAAVLVKEKLIKYTDLKPYRSKEHNTDEQPWDPISAVTAALIGDVGSISMAIADFPREMFKRSVAMKDECKSKASSSSTAREPASAATSETASVDNAAMSGALPRSDSVSVSDGASLSTHQSHPSLTISAPEHVSVSEPASASAAASSENLTTTTSADRPLTPSSLKGKLPSRSTSPNPGPSGLNLENALDASKGVGRIVTTGVRSPLNFCMGLARGFRNAPKLYNDDTVRPPEKVTDLASGLKLAGKEFGLGLYDGISGLVTQPIRGAEKEGAAGLIKGFGKGIGGLVFKPAAGFWSLPAYAMKGVDAQIRSFFSKSVLNYIITSRALQGMEELQSATEEEQQDIVARWGVRRKELKGFYHLKQKEKGKGKAKENDQGDDSSVTPPATPFSPDDAGTATSPQARTSWFHTRNMSFDERKIGHSMREAWRARKSGTSSPTRSHHRTGSFYTADEHDEFEKAIRDSVRQTSRGNPEEDARVEEAIRASVLQMQRIAETSTIGSSRPSTRDDFTLYSAPSTATSVSELPTHGQLVAELPTPEQLKRGPEPVTGDITDEEYQALIEEAVRRSVTENTAQGRGRGDDDGADNEQLRRAMEESGRHQATRGHEDDEALRRAIAESQKHHQQASAAGAEADEELKRALAESEKVHKERERERTEEEIVLEYIKKQSLAEEEHRQRLEKAKGKMASKSDGDGGEEEEELRRAMEESLKTKLGGGGSGGGGGEGSGGGGGGGSGGGSSAFHPAGRAELP